MLRLTASTARLQHLLMVEQNWNQGLLSITGSLQGKTTHRAYRSSPDTVHVPRIAIAQREEAVGDTWRGSFELQLCTVLHVCCRWHQLVQEYVGSAVVCAVHAYC